MKKALRLTSLLMVLLALLTLFARAPKVSKVTEKMDKKGYYTLTNLKVKEFTDVLDDKEIKYANVFAFASAEDNSMQAEEMKDEYVVAIYFAEKKDAKDAYDAVKEAFAKEGRVFKRSGKCVYFGTTKGVKDFA